MRDAVIKTDGKSYGTLDFWAAPVVTIKLQNANQLLHQDDFSVTYSMPMHKLMMKPLFLSAIIFTMLMMLLISSRVDLSLVDDVQSNKRD